MCCAQDGFCTELLFIFDIDIYFCHQMQIQLTTFEFGKGYLFYLWATDYISNFFIILPSDYIFKIVALNDSMSKV